jgi:hypothetical protein
VLAAAVALQTAPVRDLIWPIDIHAIVQAVEGGLYEVTGQDVDAVRAGQRIERDQVVRTGSDSGAVLVLADGTSVEMAARSELSLGRARNGVKIRLGRGNVIVHAAKQRDGRLYVETSDSVISVVGTVFAVNAGVKGSRVTVIEGEVEVEFGETTESVLPGQQAYTNPEMGPVPLDLEIAWSRNAEALRKEIAAFGRDFAQRVQDASMRFTSNLVPLVPEDTFVLASLPNATQPFSDSYVLFRRRITENAALDSWWRELDGSGGRVKADELVRMFAEAGFHLGPEVLLAFPKGMTHAPLLLSDTTNAAGLIAALQSNISKLDSGVRFAHSAEELAALSGDVLAVYAENDLVLAGQVRELRRAIAVDRGQAASGFVQTPLYRRLEQAYTEGVGWLVAADLRQIVPADSAELSQLGLGDMQQLVLEQKTGVGSAASVASLGFSQTRRAMAAWLAAPAPMGSLEFVSPEAYAVSAVLVKDPALILDDVLGMIQQQSGASEDLQDFQRRLQIDLRRDLAEPFGNEFLIAVDGPVLPTPSWKLVAEVRDAPRLENAIQWLVTNVNRESELAGGPMLTLASETVEGRTYHSLTSAEASGAAVHFTFWAGYMIVGPSRALLAETIRNHGAGNTLGRSAILRERMPPENRDFFSAIMYQNVQLALAGISENETLKSALGELAGNSLVDSLPALVCVYGEPDRIVVSSRGAFGVNLAGMLGLQGTLLASGLR